MASASEAARPTASSPPGSRDRLLPWIAAERAFRALVVLAAGIVLLTHPHTNWASEISHLAHRLGLDPNTNWVRKLIDRVRHVSARREAVFGVLALAYAALEGAEAYGLWRRRRWGEWLTVAATSLFIVPEVWELSKGLSALKLGGLIVNVLVVAYLAARLRHGEGRRRA